MKHIVNIEISECFDTMTRLYWGEKHHQNEGKTGFEATRAEREVVRNPKWHLNGFQIYSVILTHFLV